jgi:hypothetical protein
MSGSQRRNIHLTARCVPGKEGANEGVQKEMVAELQPEPSVGINSPGYKQKL